MIIVISGASSGIGYALTEYYARVGATVVAIARRTAPLISLLTDRPDMAKRLHLFAADVTDRTRIAEIVASVERSVGPIDVAIACAGIAEEQNSADLDLSALDRALNTNVLGTFNLLVPVAAVMRRRACGQLVAISSLAAEHSLPHMAAYCMSKAAVNSGMESLDLLIGGSGVYVTTVCPSFIATQMTAGRVQPRRCMSLDRAVSRIVNAIERRKKVCRFPYSTYLVLCLLRVIPSSLRRSVLKRATNLVVPMRPNPPLHSGDH